MIQIIFGYQYIHLNECPELCKEESLKTLAGCILCESNISGEQLKDRLRSSKGIMDMYRPLICDIIAWYGSNNSLTDKDREDSSDTSCIAQIKKDETVYLFLKKYNNSNKHNQYKEYNQQLYDGVCYLLQNKKESLLGLCRIYNNAYGYNTRYQDVEQHLYTVLLEIRQGKVPPEFKLYNFQFEKETTAWQDFVDFVGSIDFTK